MEETKMNRALGTKWFTFYTKVRPWLGTLAFLAIIVDFFQYTNIYLNFWWMSLNFLTGIAQFVLSIMIFVKSKGDYKDFVRFVNGVLVFEIISIAYQMGVQQYAKSFEAGGALIMSAVALIVGYFLWYRLNIKYFEKRILEETADVSNFDFKITSNFLQASETTTQEIVDSGNAPIDDLKEMNILVKEPEFVFCVECGAQVLRSSRFCHKCGKKNQGNASSNAGPTIHSEKSREYIFCTECGTQMLRDARFCPKCGARNQTIEAHKWAYCAECGAQILRESRFCYKCGNKK